MSRIGRQPIPLPAGVKVQIQPKSVEVQGPKGKLTKGFQKDLDIVGVGYRAELKGTFVNFSLGYSHPIEFQIPAGIQITVEKQTHLAVSGADRARVGQVAADLRALRPPDPYKQKGIRITGERLKKKAGKAGAAKTGA